MAEENDSKPLGRVDTKTAAVEMRATAQALTSMAASLKNLKGEAGELAGDISKTITKAAGAYRDISSEVYNTVEGERDYEKILKKNQEIKQQMLDLEVEKEIVLARISSATDDEIAGYRTLLRGIYDTVDAVEAQATATAQVAETTNQIVEAGEKFKNLAEKFGEIPLIGGLIAGPLNKAADAATRAAADGAGPLSARLQGAAAAAMELGKNFGPAALLGSVMSAAKETKKLSTNLGISLDSATEMQKRFGQFAADSRDSRITSTKLAEAQNSLQQSLKLGVEFSGETLENFTKLTKYMGVSEAAASRLALLTEGSALSSDEFQSSLAQSVVESNKALGVNVSLSEAFETIGSASASTYLTLRRSPQQLGKIVAEAKKLGLEFSQIESIASSMLDFESSIQAELEAEVLTGKQLNFERARMAALQGDTLTLTREIASQVGTIAEFENMNVIARESLAKSMGMNSDQMAEMLLKSEALKANEEIASEMSAEQLQTARDKVSATKSLGEALLEVNQEASVDQTFQDATGKLVDAFKEIAILVTPLVTRIADLFAKFASSPLGKVGVSLAAAGVGAATVMSMLKGMRGIHPAMPLYTKDATAGGGMVQAKSGEMFPANSPQGKMIRTKGGTVPANAGRFKATAGTMALGAGIGIAGSMVGAQMQKSGHEAMGKGVSMGAQGAMMGAMFGPMGMAIGGGVGFLAGAITGHLEKQEKARAEAEQKRQDDYQKMLQEQAQQQATIYLDSNKVGMGLTLGTNYKTQ